MVCTFDRDWQRQSHEQPGPPPPSAAGLRSGPRIATQRLRQIEPALRKCGASPYWSPFKLGSFGNVVTQAGAEAHYILLIAWTHGQGKWKSAAALPGNHFSELTFRRKRYVRRAGRVHKSARQ